VIGASTSAAAARGAFRLGATALLGVIALFLAGLSAPAAAQSPAQKQYNQGVPEPDGSAPGQGEAGAGKGKEAGKGKRQEKGEKGAQSGQEGKLTFADSDDDGLSTWAIILIVLAVIAAGTLAYWWWQERRVGDGPEPPAAGGPPPA
jgi:hypothetical protein